MSCDKEFMYFKQWIRVGFSADPGQAFDLYADPSRSGSWSDIAVTKSRIFK
jgi:hypothetical protein